MLPRSRCALLLVSFVATLTVRAEVEFAGYLVNGSETKFTLTDSAAQSSSEWLAIGGSFAGYKVTGFDPKIEALTVEKEGVATTLRLRSARVQATPATAPAAVAPPSAVLATTEAEVSEARARLAGAQARLQKLQAERQKLEEANPERRDRAQKQIPELRRSQAEEEKRAKEAKDAPPPAAKP